VLGTVAGEVVLVARDPCNVDDSAISPGIRCVTDIRRGIGPVGGLHAGARAVRNESFFVCACDMPCVESDVVQYLFSQLEWYDAAIPSWREGMIEPLHAVYRTRPLLAQLDEPSLVSLRDVVNRINARFVPIEEIRRIDPSLRTFTNINKIEDLKRLNGHTTPG